MDIDAQIRYYANGLLEDYYRVRCLPFVRYGAENCSYLVRNTARRSLTPIWRSSETKSEWDSEDEWTSEDGAEDAHVADNANTSNAAEFSE